MRLELIRHRSPGLVAVVVSERQGTPTLATAVGARSEYMVWLVFCLTRTLVNLIDQRPVSRHLPAFLHVFFKEGGPRRDG